MALRRTSSPPGRAAVDFVDEPYAFDARHTCFGCPASAPTPSSRLARGSVAELGTFAEMRGRRPRLEAVGHQIRDAQNLAYQFPNLFTQVKDQRLEFWQATKITRECRELTLDRP